MNSVQTIISPALCSAGSSANPQEARSFEFFRCETIPGIGGHLEGTTWTLVLQTCETELIIRQAAIALGALHEKLSLQTKCGSTQIETEFPMKQYGKALAAVRNYLSTKEQLKLNVVLICALICISIEAMQNRFLNALIHLDTSLQLLQKPSSYSKFSGVEPDSDMSRVFLNLDLHASKLKAMRPPSIVVDIEEIIPGRFSSITQAKDVLARLTAHLYVFIRSVVEEYKYRKLQPIPLDDVAAGVLIKDGYDAWKDRLNKF